MPTRKPAMKHAVLYVTDSITPGSLDRKHVENLFNLHSVIEAIRASDGMQLQVANIRIDLRVYGASGVAITPYSITPVLVQTAGTFADTLDQDTPVIADALNAAIDDVFGYQKIGQTQISRFHYTNNGSFGVQLSLQIPQSALQILNKEMETERLQDLYLGFVMHGGLNAVAHSVWCFLAIDYREVRKQLVLR